MELVKLGAKGQVTIPRSVLRSVGLTGDTPLLVDTTPEGTFLLRQAAISAIEIYSEPRLAAAPMPRWPSRHRDADLPRYRRRQPEQTALYRVVQQRLETCLAPLGEGDWDGQGVPAHVERKFRRYLARGMLADGFARARCPDCGHDFLVAFFCKGRGLCPSCIEGIFKPIEKADDDPQAGRGRAATELTLGDVAAITEPVHIRVLRRFARSSLIELDAVREVLAWEMPLTCPNCGADMRLIAFITEAAPCERMLTHIGEPLRPPPITPVDGPPSGDDTPEPVPG